MVELERSSTAYRGKSATRQHMNRSSKKIVKEEGEQRKVRRTFKMLRKIWLNIEIEKIDIYEGITVKALLNSGTTEMFINRKIVAKYSFKLQKLKKLVVIRNVNRTNNSIGIITYQVEVNVYYKNHIERMRIDICNLEKIKVILKIP